MRKLLSKLNPLNVLIPKRPAEYRPWLAAHPIVAVVKGKVLSQYSVGGEVGATVTIVESGGRGHYLVSEPKLSQEEQRMYYELMQHLLYTLTESEVGLTPGYVEGAMWAAAEELGLVWELKHSAAKFRYYMLRNVFGYGPIHVPMLDPDVEEITCARADVPVSVRHRRYTRYHWMPTNIRFESEAELNTFVQRIAQKGGKTLSVAVPEVEVIMPEGDRFAATYGREATTSPSFTMRKFPRQPLSLPSLVANRTLSPLLAAYLWEVLELKGMVMVLGATGSGKTTLVSSLLTAVPPSFKVVTIEDSPEIRLPHQCWTAMHTRTPSTLADVATAIGYEQLLKHALRHRPDLIVVGEARGREMVDLISAAATGHGGASTFHAGSLEEALVRWRSSPMNLDDAQLGVMWCIPVIREVEQVGGENIRRVTEVWEVRFAGRLERFKLFTWSPRGDSFSPGTAGEVARRSERLRVAYEAKGLGTKDLARSLSRKAGLLQRMVKEKRLAYQDFSEEVAKYYR